MPMSVPIDVSNFVAKQVASGRYKTADEVLRSAIHALAEQDKDLVAVQQAIAEWRDGDVGIPLDQAIEQIRISSQCHSQ